MLKSQHVPPSGYLQFKLEMSVEPTTKSFLMMLRIHAFKKGGKKTRPGNHIFKNEEEKIVVLFPIAKHQLSHDSR